jgi:hypothetical protein
VLGWPEPPVPDPDPELPEPDPKVPVPEPDPELPEPEPVEGVVPPEVELALPPHPNVSEIEAIATNADRRLIQVLSAVTQRSAEPWLEQELRPGCMQSLPKKGMNLYMLGVSASPARLSLRVTRVGRYSQPDLRVVSRVELTRHLWTL